MLRDKIGECLTLKLFICYLKYENMAKWLKTFVMHRPSEFPHSSHLPSQSPLPLFREANNKMEGAVSQLEEDRLTAVKKAQRFREELKKKSVVSLTDCAY